MKLVNAIIIVMMTIAAIRIGHAWYTGMPASPAVWFLAITACADAVWRSAVRFFGGSA